MDLSFPSYYDLIELSHSFSSETRPIPPDHQVFINFRGELREGFLKVLVDTLKEELVNVFVDEDAVRGEDLTILFDRIEQSRIAVTIFSERYTGSKWCLNELVKIKECIDKGKLEAIPIFFNVEAEDVKKLEGNFGRNFRKLKKMHDKEKEMTKKWKDALKSVSGKFGLASDIRYHRDVPFLFLRSLYEWYFANLVTIEVKRLLTDISKRLEEERIRQTREREQLAEAKRNSLSGKTKELIKSVVPSGVLFFLITILVAPYLLCFICGILYYTGSFSNQSNLNGNGRWVNNDRVVIL